MRSLRRGDLSFLLLVVVVGATCLRLGIWQLDRLSERRARNAAIAEQLALPALAIPGAEIDPTIHAYRRAEARGTFDPDHSLRLTGRARDGVPGDHLVTPLRLEGQDAALLVLRGWLPHESGEGGVDEAPAGAVEVTGVLRPPPETPGWSFLADPTPAPGDAFRRDWRLLNLDALARQSPDPLLPLILEADHATAPPPAVPVSTIDLSEGSHLSYAVQWFAFAAIAAAGGGIWLRSRLRRPAG